MEEGVTIPARVGPKSTLGSLTVAALFGALIAITLLYVWGANIARERGVETSGSPTELGQ